MSKPDVLDELTPTLDQYIDSARYHRQCEINPSDRYVLIEESRIDKTTLASSHKTKSAAAAYHDECEYADDWKVVVLFDVRFGERWYGKVKTGWEKV